MDLEQSTIPFKIDFVDIEKASEVLKQINQDSIIQRFEYTVELLWKYLKEYFQVKFLI